jgi:hypothetical protein
MEKTYLGDGLYAEFDGFQIRVFASDGISDTDEVFFEGANLVAFLAFVKRVEDLSA